MEGQVLTLYKKKFNQLEIAENLYLVRQYKEMLYQQQMQALYETPENQQMIRISKQDSRLSVLLYFYDNHADCAVAAAPCLLGHSSAVQSQVQWIANSSLPFAKIPLGSRVAHHTSHTSHESPGSRVTRKPSHTSPESAAHARWRGCSDNANALANRAKR